MYVKKDGFYVQGHFPGQPVMPGVLIVEAFGQAAAALTAHGIDKKEYENKLVFLMSVEKARFRNPVIPDCKLELKIEKTVIINRYGRLTYLIVFKIVFFVRLIESPRSQISKCLTFIKSILLINLY